MERLNKLVLPLLISMYMYFKENYPEHYVTIDYMVKYIRVPRDYLLILKSHIHYTFLFFSREHQYLYLSPVCIILKRSSNEAVFFVMLSASCSLPGHQLTLDSLPVPSICLTLQMSRLNFLSVTTVIECAVSTDLLLSTIVTRGTCPSSQTLPQSFLLYKKPP